MVKGPFFNLDFRWFYVMYSVMFVYCGYRWWIIEDMRAARLQNSEEDDLDYRWDKFGDDYEEELRDEGASANFEKVKAIKKHIAQR